MCVCVCVCARARDDGRDNGERRKRATIEEVRPPPFSHPKNKSHHPVDELSPAHLRVLPIRLNSTLSAKLQRP